MIKGKNKKKIKKDNKHYWYHYDNRKNMNNDYPYNQYDDELNIKKNNTMEVK